MNRIDLAQLADFLRRSRERIDPSSVGLSPRTRMRTPGLRREDVAQMPGSPSTITHVWNSSAAPGPPNR